MLSVILRLLVLWPAAEQARDSWPWGRGSGTGKALPLEHTGRSLDGWILTRETVRVCLGLCSPACAGPAVGWSSVPGSPLSLRRHGGAARAGALGAVGGTCCQSGGLRGRACTLPGHVAVARPQTRAGWGPAATEDTPRKHPTACSSNRAKLPLTLGGYQFT